MVAANDNRGPEFLAVCCTGIAIAAVTVILRLMVRTKVVCKVGVDDWLAALSLILSLAALSCLVASVHFGVGRHMEFLDPKDSKTALKLVWVGFCIVPSAEGTAKFSISVMLIRITTSKKWKTFFYTLIVLFSIIILTKLVGILASCQPVGRLWDPSLEGTCNVDERTTIIYIQGVMAAGYDIILAISPIVLLWDVKINLQKKMLLCGLLALGFFTSVAGMIRVTYTSESMNTTDPTWAIINFLIWKTIELPLSIIVGCLPTLQPLLHFFKPQRSIDDAQPLRCLQHQDHCSKVTGDNSTKGTTSVSVSTAQRSSGNSLPSQTGRRVEDRV